MQRCVLNLYILRLNLVGKSILVGGNRVSAKSLSPEAYEWLSRCTYGVNEALADRFMKSGTQDRERWNAYLNEQLNHDSFLDAETENRIEKLQLKTLKLSLTDLWSNHFLASRKTAQLSGREAPMSMTAEQEKKTRKARREVALEPVLDLEQASWLRMIYSRFQIYERMVEFWHDHFNVYAYEGRLAPGFAVLNRDVIRPNALGNFRRLLGLVCRNPAMLVYLDNAYNQSGNPNENFARELFELHTLGAENYFGTLDRDKVPLDKNKNPAGYVDGDVYEAARAFTGWRIEDGGSGLKSNTGIFHYSDVWHDRFQKIVLGRRFGEHQPPMKDGDDVLDALCSHIGTARFVVGKLCRKFTSDNPPPAFVQKMSETFLSRKDSPTQIRDTLSDILRSEEYLSKQSKKFKRPVDYLASIIRVTAESFEPSDKFISGANKAGQRLFGWKTPDGPPDDASPWQSPQSLIERWRAAQQLIFSEIDKGSLKRLIPPERPTPELIADELSSRFLGPRMDETLRVLLVERASGGRRADVSLPEQLLSERVDRVVELLVMSPAFQLR